MISSFANRILDYISINKSYGCPMINDFFVHFDGRIDTDQKAVTLCYEGLRGIDMPTVALGKTGKETIEKFMQLRAGVISEGAPSTTERVFTKGCVKCAFYKLGRWKNNKLIRYINLSMYPAPCQCRCIYCGYKNDLQFKENEAVAEGYNIVFDAIDYAFKIGLIAPDATWQISSGEITIHPYRDRIFDLVKNKTATFYTNCFLYNENIGANLKANQNSRINLSIDAGTPETWRKIKGFDNYKGVIDNLDRYYKNSSRAGQIELKYIVLPGINDNQEDYSKIIEIMKKLGINNLSLAYDIYDISDEVNEKIISAAGYLLAMLEKNKMVSGMHLFAPSERKSIQAFANELLASGKV